MEDVKGQHGLVALSDELVFDVEIPRSQAQHKGDPAPAGNTHGYIENHVHQ